MLVLHSFAPAHPSRRIPLNVLRLLVVGFLFLCSTSLLQAVPVHPDATDGGGIGGNPASSPGTSYPWVSSIDGVSTATGNKMTEIPTVSWVARGGLIVDLTLYHNSESNVGSPSRGAKWALLYDTNRCLEKAVTEHCVSERYGQRSSHRRLHGFRRRPRVVKTPGHIQ